MKNQIRISLKLSLILISAFISASAFWGGFNLVNDPTGSAINLHIYLPLIPFVENYHSLGLMLIFFNGVSQFLVFFLIITNNNYAGVIAAVGASILIIWSSVQLYFIGWMFYSGFYFVIAIIEILLGIVYFFFLKKYIYNETKKTGERKEFDDN